MPRTTVDIDASVLRELKKRQQREKRTLGRLVSELLAQALAAQSDTASPAFTWVSQPMGAKVDLEDKGALYALLDKQ